MDKKILVSAISLVVGSFGAQAANDISINNMLFGTTNYSSGGTLKEDGTGSMSSVDPFFYHTWTASQETVFLDSTGTFSGTSIQGAYDYDDEIAAMTANQVAVGIFFDWNGSNDIAILEIFDCVSTHGICIGQGVPMDNGPFLGSIAIFSGGQTLNLVCNDVSDYTATDTSKWFSISEILTNNCVNVDGTPTLDSFDVTSSAGGTITSDGFVLTYVPPVGFDGQDSFTYTAKDDSSTSTATIFIQVLDSPLSNFTILGASGGNFGGTNDVTIVWDETSFNSSSIDANSIPIDTNFNLITISSPQLFFNSNWAAHHIRVFQGPGTFEFDVTCTAADYDAGIVDCNRPLAEQGATQRFTNMTLAAGEVGVHLLLAWGSDSVVTACGQANCDIDVINVWHANEQWDDHGDAPPVNQLWRGVAGLPPTFDTTWTQVSTDFNGDGINGSPMVDGPFIDNYINFNYKTVVNLPDFDGDGLSDSIDPDDDNDGLLDTLEDSNGNGVVDAGETNPFDSDSDDDGLQDGIEDANSNGMVDAGETSPLNSDSDTDGLSDGYEVFVLGSDPTSATTVYIAPPGDINNDGGVNAGDLILLRKQILEN